jgi:hypothetical protein
MATTLKDKSRKNWDTQHEEFLGYDELKVGALQRIADATEAMAKNHIQLINELERYKSYYTHTLKRAVNAERSNAALRGVITKLKRKK